MQNFNESIENKDTFMRTLYTLSKINAKEELYGVQHGSTDAIETLCGLKISARSWYIVDNAFKGEIGCNDCLKVLKVGLIYAKEVKSV